jgi:Fe-S cluster biogenesis protein NfuA
MRTVEPEVVEAALDELRPGLASDGFKLGLHELTSDGRIVIAVEALPTACMDCLVPDDMLTLMLETVIRGRSPEAGVVEIVKVGFDTAEHT